MNNYIKEIKAILIFASIGLIIFTFCFLIAYFKIEYYFYYSLLAYIGLSGLLAILSNIINSKIFSTVTKYILAPAWIILTIITIVLPFGTIFIHIVYYIAFSIMLPFGVFKILDFFQISIFTIPATQLYIKFTSSVLIAVLFNFQIRKCIYKISPMRINKSEKLKPYELAKLTDYLLSENNVRFLIYGIYVILLLTINLKNFETTSLSNNLSNDKAILQSFVTFIAFDRALMLLKQLEFKPSDFLKKIVRSIINKFNDFDKENEKYK